MLANKGLLSKRLRTQFTNFGRRGFATKEYITKDAARFVNPSKKLRVGIWLLSTTAVLGTLGTFGGYTRNMRFGMNKIEWRAKGSLPSTDDEWAESYQDFQKYPEFHARGQPVTLDQYKQMFLMNKIQSALGPGTLLVHLVPMLFFLRGGVFTAKGKKFALIYSGLLAAIGLQGTYMDSQRPGMKEGEPMPPKSPYQKALHNGLCFTYFGYGLWMALNMLRRSPDNVRKLERYFGKNTLRRQLMISSHLLFPLVLITGFMMAGTGAGRAINTYPKVGENWTLTSEDLDKDESFFANLYKNPKLIHFNHRTLGMGLAGLTTLQWFIVMRSKVGIMGKLGFTTLLALLLGQLHLGGHIVTHRMQPEGVLMHEGNAFLILALFLYLMHIVRKPNPKIIQEIANRLKNANPQKYEVVAKKYPKEMKKILK